MARDCDHPNPGNPIRTGQPHQLPQPPTNPVPLHRAADAFGSNQPDPGRSASPDHPQRHESSAVGAPLRLHPEKLRASRKPDGLGKGQRHKGATFNQPARRSEERPADSELSLSMAREVNFNALRQQALAAALTTAGKDGAAALGLHAFAEPELLFTGALGRLVGTFHKPGKRAETLAAPPPLSTGSWADFASAARRPAFNRPNNTPSPWDLPAISPSRPRE